MNKLKAILDLVNNVANSRDANKLTAAIYDFERENHKLKVQIYELQKENLTLKHQISSQDIIIDIQLKKQPELKKLKAELAKTRKKFKQLEKKYNEKYSREGIEKKYTYIQKYGIFQNKETKHYFCTSCLKSDPPVESPLSSRQNGWRCQLKQCNKFYSNPDYKNPPTHNNDRKWHIY